MSTEMNRYLETDRLGVLDPVFSLTEYSQIPTAIAVAVVLLKVKKELETA